jgi:hypothetical protein
VTCPSEKGPQNVHFVPQIRQTYGSSGIKEKMLVLLLIEPRSSGPAMLLAGLSQHIRFDVARTLLSNGNRQAQSVAVIKQINVHRIVVGNRLGRSENRETRVIILKWMVEELLLSTGLTKS